MGEQEALQLVEIGGGEGLVAAEALHGELILVGSQIRARPAGMRVSSMALVLRMMSGRPQQQASTGPNHSASLV
jgi:hypothetical protein